MFQRRNNIRIDIAKYYFDPDGAIISGATLPVDLQIRVPWFMSGKFDYDCNYRNTANIMNPNPWQFLGVYNRAEFKFLFTGLNNVQAVMQNGDLSLLYADDVINPSYYCLVTMASQGNGLTGIVQNAEFHCPYFDLYSDNPVKDYNESLMFAKISKFGVAIKYDNYPISDAYGPMTRPLNNKIGIDREFLFSFYNVIGGWINFETTAYYVDFRRITYPQD